MLKNEQRTVPDLGAMVAAVAMLSQAHPQIDTDNDPIKAYRFVGRILVERLQYDEMVSETPTLKFEGHKKANVDAQGYWGVKELCLTSARRVDATAPQLSALVNLSTFDFVLHPKVEVTQIEIWYGNWSKIPWLIKTWWKELSGGKSFAIKGIQSVQDARKCVEVGCDGIVVSNHAGRQVDGAIASLDALEKIVDAVGDKTHIMFDSGIRGAADVTKALALGAKFVYVGRLWVWGLSIMGEHGVRHVMKSLLADLDILFNVAGIQNVNQLDRSWLDSQRKGAGPIAERSKL
ncbi:FMN-linked oxidoreductase [Teratosphaeria nubilosa]|uniref:FMN-linked oxidoreductase n=1 Tax=Teratosphaeria nubilosa TaxID=161662 RepID=A0A6G1LE92_9PEZI|nr:FMN-linked oxidoreductase [Teratosphaeria nubilosa]